MNKKKGVLITFEGIEGCGKSTQIIYAAHYLRSMNYKVCAAVLPGPGGKATRAFPEISWSG
jgi:thymidylate kinase